MLKNKAGKNPSTSKPLITVEESQTKKAFITKVNSPKVKILTGKVIKIKIGLIAKLITAKNTASHKAAHTPLTATPETSLAAIKIDAAIISHFKINFMETELKIMNHELRLWI